MSDKRKAEDYIQGSNSNGQPNSNSSSSMMSLAKRARVEDEDSATANSTSLISISSADGGKDKSVVRSINRTSKLSSPILNLAGAHGSEILDVQFSPDGQYIVAASSDKHLSLWTTYGESSNLGLLKGHSKAITSISFLSTSSSTDPQLVSSSADATLILWDLLTGTKLRRFRAHTGIVNSVATSRSGRNLAVSGGDDGLVCIWDLNQKDPLDVIEVGYPVTAVEFAADNSKVFVGGLDNDVHVYDLTRKTIVYSLRGHLSHILSLSLSNSGSYLLSSSADDTLRIWDVRPFASTDENSTNDKDPRLFRTLTGAAAGWENLLIKARWSKDGERVGTGGGDRFCTIWNVESSKILYKLPGHKGTCTAIAFHPKEPIIVSSSVDRTLILGEIEP